LIKGGLEYRTRETTSLRQYRCTQGCCAPCHRGFEPNPDTYMTSPATHLLAA
jgi:hypothetical protein